MTIVLGMRFSPSSGLLAADEQTSYGARKSDFSEKIYVAPGGDLPSMLAGGAGSAQMIRRVMMRYNDSEERGVEVFHRIVHASKIAAFDDYLHSKYGVGINAFHTGLDARGNPIGEALKRRIEGAIDTNGSEIADMVNNSFVIIEPATMDIWTTGMLSPTLFPSPRPYAITGSGADIADARLSTFYTGVAREDRANIPFMNGLRAALLAMDDSARMNVGVGGVPSMAVVRDGAFYRPTQRNSRLAVELVRSEDKGLIEDGFVDENLEQLIEDDRSFSDVYRNFPRAAKNRTKLDLFLRGYIV